MAEEEEEEEAKHIAQHNNAPKLLRFSSIKWKVEMIEWSHHISTGKFVIAYKYARVMMIQ